jgi:hypothetical protein
LSTKKIFYVLSLIWAGSASVSAVADPESCRFVLGSGNGGKVHIVRQTGENFLEKTFHEISQARNDQMLLEIANHYLSVDPSLDSFHVVVPEWDKNRTTRRRLIEGRDLHTILLDPDTNKEEAMEFIHRFKAASLELGRIISKNYYHVEIKEIPFKPGYFTSDKRNDGSSTYFINFYTTPQNWLIRSTGLGERKSFILKTDNIILEKSSNYMYLIDPQ